MTNPLRVAAYCRVSTDKDDQANSLISQKKYFTEYITCHENWILNNIYYDEGISGTQTKKRAGFNAMMEEAYNGGIDLILTKEVCRFARNTVDTLSFTRKLKDMGVGVIFTIDNIDTRDCDGELRLTLMASIAQEESRKTSERVKWGQKRRMEQGIVFGRDLLGYTVHKGSLTINETEAPIVRTIFQKYTNEGKGSHVIARELEEEGIYPKYSLHWSNAVILKILKNEKYAGDLCQKKTFTPNYLTHAKQCNRGNEDMIYLTNHHEPIIDRILWERTQKELLRRASTYESKTKYSNRYWCSGKIYCGICQSRYVSKTRQRSDHTTYRAWRCSKNAVHGSGKKTNNNPLCGCNNSSINEEALLTCMHYCLHYCIRQFDINLEELQQEIMQDIQSIKTITHKTLDFEHLKEQISILNQKRQRAINLTVDGLITKEDLREQLLLYDKQIAHYAKITNLPSHKSDTYTQYYSALKELLTFSTSNTLLYGEILEKVIICNNNTVKIQLKCIPFSFNLMIKSHGKRETYVTEIINAKIF